MRHIHFIYYNPFCNTILKSCCKISTVHKTNKTTCTLADDNSPKLPFERALPGTPETNRK